MQNIPPSFPTARYPQKWEQPPLLFPMLAHLSPFVGTRAPSSLPFSLLVLAGLSWKTRLGGRGKSRMRNGHGNHQEAFFPSKKLRFLLLAPSIQDISAKDDGDSTPSIMQEYSYPTSFQSFLSPPPRQESTGGGTRERRGGATLISRTPSIMISS